mmetsp:Transcript_19156/g.62580  ORF Transcript_19156/g.62580 Transcript_19156/m.62580 type:complete len:264 (+) Transcript_19156:625-1416(+)
MAGWRKAALSSKPTLASAAIRLPSASSANGLTSTIVQSKSVKSLYSALICSAAAALSPLTPKPETTSKACASVMPRVMSTGTLMIFSGLDWARSSMEVPPSAQATSKGPMVARSRVMEKYISFTRCIFLAMRRVSTGLPSGPDCLVTSLPPSIFPAYSAIWLVLITCTPPLNPFVKVPSPRPPARIWDLMTTSSSPILAAAATASSTLLAGNPNGTLTPFSFMRAALWYSCRFRFRTNERTGASARRDCERNSIAMRARTVMG